jgi:hypothetical protein
VIVKFDSTEFQAALAKLRTAAKAGLIDPSFGTLPVQARLAAERIGKFTPPKTKDQGEAAIRGDLFNIFELRRKETIEAYLKQAGAGAFTGWIHNNPLKVHVLVSSGGVIQSLADARAVHERFLNNRGRIRRIACKFMISREVLDQYLAELWGQIGKARAGWAVGAMALGSSDVLGWVARHLMDGQGTFQNGLNDQRPFIAIANNSRWAGRESEAERIVAGALAARARDMQAWLEKQMELAAKKAVS